jgi:hypothetical protein
MKTLKTFVLIYDDVTCSTTQHYEIEPLKTCYLNQEVLVYVEPRDIRFCIGISELLPPDETLKSFWNEVINAEFELQKMAEKVWNDIYNNGTLTYNTFEEYYKNLKL